MNIDNIILDCQRAMEPVTKDFGLSLDLLKKESWGFKIFYKNQVAGILITYEIKGVALMFDVLDFEESKLTSGASQTSSDVKFSSYDLNDIVSISNPAAIVETFPSFSNKELFAERIDKNIKNIYKYAAEILRGDFATLELVRKKVEARALKKPPGSGVRL